MSKKKNKQQKRAFFSRPENRKKTFKKQEKTPNEGGVELRERGGFDWICDPSIKAPHCAHGPCLLFHDKKQNARIFTCAVYRNEEKCPFRATVQEDGSVQQTSEEVEVPLPAKYKGGVIPKKLKSIPLDSQLVFCAECNDVFEKKHAHPSVYVQREELRRPSQLLAAIEDQQGEAQFWFSPPSLSVVASTVSASGADGVLCIGAARLFEELKEEKKKDRKLFMLDYDGRYASFHRLAEFARYSMLVDYLPGKAAAERLSAFFASVSRLLIVSDPPFGVFIEPLVRSIENMRERHRVARAEQPCVSFSMLLLPLFVGKHALKSYSGELSMADYRVCYANHKQFAKPNKSIVRIFTDLPKETVDLTGVEGYRFCPMCERHVAVANKHCGMCGDCTSKDGSPYRHCDRCMRCVKQSYRHCKKCGRCHLEGRCRQAEAAPLPE